MSGSIPVYTQGFGTASITEAVPFTVPPTTSQTNYPIGQIGVVESAGAFYGLASKATTSGAVQATWVLFGTAGGPLNTLTGDSGGAISPSAGNITLAGTAAQILTTGSGSTITFSLIGPYTPGTYTAHGVLIGEGASSIVATTPGTTGQVLIGSTGADPAFDALGVNSGLTAHGVLLGENNSAIVATAAATDGQLLIGATGADPAFASLTSSGSTITVTGGANTLNIDVAAPLNVAHGGTGATTLTGVLTGHGTGAVTGAAVTQHGVVLGAASNAVTSLGVAATGATLMGATGADPAFTGSPSFSGSVTAATTITATSGAITATLGNLVATNGNLVLGTAGNKILSTSVGTTTAAGANSFGSVTLVGGTATVATTAVTADSLIVIWRQSIGATGAAALGELTVGTIVAATSFDINAALTATATSLVTTDVSVVGWMIIN